MKRRASVALALVLALVSCAVPAGAPLSHAAGEAAESSRAAARNDTLADTINRYRQRRGLAAVPLSASLTLVAATHLADLEQHYRAGGACNMHSWSAGGNWSPCCYTADGRQAACMWHKPRELTQGRYAAAGYEMVAHYTDPITPDVALETWQESPAHHAMVLNTGRWADNTWRAMGAAIGEHYAVVWFGELADTAGN